MAEIATNMKPRIPTALILAFIDNLNISNSHSDYGTLSISLFL